MRKIIFKIVHNGSEWVVENELLMLSSKTIDGLDKRLVNTLRGKGLIKPGEKVKVLMEFDSSSIPQWIRQYTHHYFDRVVEIEG